MTPNFLKRKYKKGLSKKEATSGKSFMKNPNNSMLKQQLETVS